VTLDGRPVAHSDHFFLPRPIQSHTYTLVAANGVERVTARASSSPTRRRLPPRTRTSAVRRRPWRRRSSRPTASFESGRGGPIRQCYLCRRVPPLRDTNWYEVCHHRLTPLDAIVLWCRWCHRSR